MIYHYALKYDSDKDRWTVGLSDLYLPATKIIDDEGYDASLDSVAYAMAADLVTYWPELKD